MDDQKLREILLALLAEVQQLRVDCAALQERLTPGVNVGDLLEAKKRAKHKAVRETAALRAKIEGLRFEASEGKKA
jgi:hypothetical protein